MSRFLVAFSYPLPSLPPPQLSNQDRTPISKHSDNRSGRTEPFLVSATFSLIIKQKSNQQLFEKHKLNSDRALCI